jgi:EF hand domain-containing protein
LITRTDDAIDALPPHLQKEFTMLKRRYLKYLPLAIAAAGIATFVGTRSFADGHAMGPDGGHGHWGRWMIQEMDANKDGKVTQAEIDADHDGKITADEIQTFREKERAKREAAMLARMDANGDGSVSVQEYQAAQTWRLARMDRNGDGTIDEQDMRGGGGMQHRHHPWSDDRSAE